MNRIKHPVFIIAVLGTCLAILWQELVPYDSVTEDRSFGLYLTVDSPSYTTPPINFITEGTWKDNSIGPSSFVQRPPGYGILVGISYLIAGNNYLMVIKVIQILVFFASVILIFRMILLTGGERKWAIISAALYAIAPCFSSTMYMVMTEGITAFLTLLAVFFWYSWQKEGKALTGFIITGAFLLLVRPQLLPLVVVLALVSFMRKKPGKMAVLIIFIPLTLWVWRTHSYTQQWSLHPIYNEENQSLYRPPHESMTKLFRIWEYNGARFHSCMAALSQDTTIASYQEAIDLIPKQFRADVGEEMRAYQLLLVNQIDDLRNGRRLKWTEEEAELTAAIDTRAAKLRSQNRLMYYITTPMKSLWELVSVSHLHQRVFQDAETDWIESFIKWLCALLLAVILLSTAVFPFLNTDADLKWLAIGMILMIGYLVFVQRLNEERYLAPLLPLMLILAATGAQKNIANLSIRDTEK